MSRTVPQLGTVGKTHRIQIGANAHTGINEVGLAIVGAAGEQRMTEQAAPGKLGKG